MEFLSYLLKVSACTALFFSFYLLVLRKLTFFKINRFYLLIVLFLSFVIPALQFEVSREIEAVKIDKLTDLPQLKPVSSQPFQLVHPLVFEYQPQEQPEINWNELGFYIYGGIASILLLACAWRLFGLFKLTGRYTKSLDGLKLITKTKGFTNCSFFNYVFIDKSSLNEIELEVLLTHEKVHVNQYHSIDKIILMICKAILWFNPVVYFFDKALEQAHEYEADEVTSLSFGTNAYANLLLKLAVTKSEMPLIHNFVKSPVKERIKMLFNSKSTKMKKLSYFLVLPVAIGLVWLFSVQVVYALPRIKSVLGFKKIEQIKNKQGIKKSKVVLGNGKSNLKAKITLKIDTAKLQNSSDPKIISFSRITGKVRTKISYLEDVIIEIRGTTIKAKSAEWDRNEKMLTASDAVITNGGNMIITEKAVFNLLRGTYRTYESNAVTEKEISFIDFDLKDNENMIAGSIKYSADSVRMSKDKNTIIVMGKAKMFFKDISMEADEIIYNNKTQMGSAKNMVITQVGSGTKIKGSNAKFNLNGKVEILQNADGNVVVDF